MGKDGRNAGNDLDPLASGETRQGEKRHMHYLIDLDPLASGETRLKAKTCIHS